MALGACLPALAALPMLHSDSFDRLLIAQAQRAGMAIVTADEKIGKYKVRTIWYHPWQDLVFDRRGIIDVASNSLKRFKS